MLQRIGRAGGVQTQFVSGPIETDFGGPQVCYLKEVWNAELRLFGGTRRVPYGVGVIR